MGYAPREKSGHLSSDVPLLGREIRKGSGRTIIVPRCPYQCTTSMWARPLATPSCRRGCAAGEIYPHHKGAIWPHLAPTRGDGSQRRPGILRPKRRQVPKPGLWVARGPLAGALRTVKEGPWVPPQQCLVHNLLIALWYPLIPSRVWTGPWLLVSEHTRSEQKRPHICRHLFYTPGNPPWMRNTPRGRASKGANPPQDAT